MFKEILYASIATLALSCTPPKKSTVDLPHVDHNETIQYVCYPKEHFSVISYQDNDNTLRIDNWGRNKRLGCFGGYSISYKTKDNEKDERDIIVLFNDKDCDNIPEDIIYVSEKELTNPKDIFNKIVSDLRSRNRTKEQMDKCLK